MPGADTAVRDGEQVHGGLVQHLGEHQVLCGLGVVVGGGPVDRAIGEGVDVDGDEDVRIRLISDIAACLQLGVIVGPWTIDVLVGAAGHDDLRTGRGEHVAQRQGDGEGDILLVDLLISFVSDGTDVRAAVAGVKADDLAFEYFSGISRYRDLLRGGLFLGSRLLGGRLFGRRILGACCRLCVALFGTLDRDVNDEAVRFSQFCIRTKGKDVDVIDLLRLGEGDVDVGVAVFFRNCGEIDGARIHIVLRAAEALLGVL